jgi:hypothetical protein
LATELVNVSAAYVSGLAPVGSDGFGLGAARGGRTYFGRFAFCFFGCVAGPFGGGGGAGARAALAAGRELFVTGTPANPAASISCRRFFRFFAIPPPAELIHHTVPIVLGTDRLIGRSGKIRA